MCRWLRFLNSILKNRLRKKVTQIMSNVSRDIRRRHRHQNGPSPDRITANSRNDGKQSSTRFRSALLTGLLLFLGITLAVLYFLYQWYLTERIRTPASVPKMLFANSSTAVVNPSRFWGTYRSQLYFGLKTRSPSSPVVGLMWLTEFTNKMPPPIRHWCDQADGLPKYGWLKHDGVNFGSQIIEEESYIMQTDFVKKQGGVYGGEWTAKISVKDKNPEKPAVVSLMFYVALDGSGHLEPVLSKKRLTSVSGYSEELGNFDVIFPKSKTQKNQKYHHLISFLPRLDKVNDVVLNGIKVEAWDSARTMPYFTLAGRIVPRDSLSAANLMVHQVTTPLPFEMEVVFQSHSFIDRQSTLSGPVFSEAFNKLSSEFDKKFTETFQLEMKGYKEREINFAKAAMSNMVGGIGYFYGSSLVQSKYNKEPLEYWEAPLLTAVPSRSFFPRGFLWDEGFHNLLISQWSPEISKDIISHWLDLINWEGWIPREQILGYEARAKVPSEFVVQKNENANPPTLFLVIQKLAAGMINSKNPADHAFLKSMYPRLQTWFHWYNSTQYGPVPLSYRWRGRDSKTIKELNPKTLTSGLDDYPRASHPTDDERHIDLYCWIALASDVMADIAKALGEKWEDYFATAQALKDNSRMDSLHWSDKKQQYSDYGLHTNRLKLEKPRPPPNLAPGQRPPNVDQEKYRVVITEPSYQYVNAFGYVSLFPFLLKMVNPTSPKLFKILTDLKDPGLLWTPYGLRSLAKSAHLYNRYNTEHDPPYWRGAIWINMNYLAISALHHYAETEGPYKTMALELYKELRSNVVANVMKEYERTGYVWENYDDRTGNGKGSHPFTGWSALVVLIMAEKY